MNLHIHTEDASKAERDGRHLQYVFEKGRCISVLDDTGMMLPGAKQVNGELLGYTLWGSTAEPTPLRGGQEELDELVGKRFGIVIRCSDGTNFRSPPIVMARREKPRSDPPNATAVTTTFPRPSMSSLPPSDGSKT